MSKSKQRDIQELTYILKNQKKITDAIKRMNVSLDSAAKNCILGDEMVFNLCSMYMAQIGESVKQLTDDTREYLVKIGDSAHHLLGLINDILDMSRIESGRFTIRKEEFSFSNMLEQINTMVMSQCNEK